MLEAPPPLLLERGPRKKGFLPVTRSFSPLPGTAREAKAIVPHLSRYAGVKPRVYLGKEALEGVFRAAERPRVVVLCTHGFFIEPESTSAALPVAGKGSRENLPGTGVEGLTLTLSATGEQMTLRDLFVMMEHPALLGGLALAGANRRGEGDATGEDGILTAWEIAGVDLRGCELAVLSACDTGLSRVQAGHPGACVAGLRQAFLVAGARNVVATLWKIPDSETVELMEGFFRRLADGTRPADALGAAQRAVIAARRKAGGAAHPFYWAAPALTGQGKGAWK
jgi:CHAT domain-containing protein